MEEYKTWAGQISEEWQEPYNGRIFDACCCTLSVCDPTWPNCLGLRYKGLCCCVQGECTSCIMTQDVDSNAAFKLHEFDLLYIKPPYFNIDPESGERGGSLCKSVCHCCCIEERFAFPSDGEVPCMFAFCCVTMFHDKKWAPKVKMAAPSSKTLREATRSAEKYEEAYEAAIESGDAPVPQVMENEAKPAKAASKKGDAAPAATPAAEPEEDESLMPKSNTFYKACKAESKKLVADKAVVSLRKSVGEATAELKKAASDLAAAAGEEEKAAAAAREAAAKKEAEDKAAELKAAEEKALAAEKNLEAVCSELAVEQAAMAAAASIELDSDIPPVVMEHVAEKQKSKRAQRRSLQISTRAPGETEYEADVISPGVAVGRAKSFFNKQASNETAVVVAKPQTVDATKLIWRQVGGVWKRVPPKTKK